MKRNNKFIYGFFFILLLGSACTDVQEEMEITGPDKQGKTVSLIITSRPLETSGVTTRSKGKGMDVILGDSGETVTRAGEAEDKIGNICIFQFEGTKEAADAKLRAKFYLSALVDKTVIVNLQSFTSSFLYVCANVGDITKSLTVGASSFQDLMNASYAVSNGDVTFGSLLPMSGCSEAFNTATLSGKLAIPLTRMVAKVTFVCDWSTLPAGATFSITDVKLRNVPQNVSYYPSVAADGYTAVDTYIGVTNGTGNTRTYTWFMPENKGRKPRELISNDGWMERFAKKAPFYATYIEVTGNYAPAGETPSEVTYVVYLGDATDVNNYDVVRNHHYKVTCRIKGISTDDKRVTLDTNLSVDGLANCYLAGKDNHWYRFDGLVMGNGNATDYVSTIYPGLKMIPDGGVNITGVTKAFVVWETADGLIQNVQWDAASGCVRFQTGTAKGNALIAVANSQNVVLWSWHIWRTNNVDLAALNESHTLNIKTNTEREWYEALPGVGKGCVRSLVLMDRNLGAAFEGELDIEDCKGVYCLHYQFGRKDPFPAGTNYNAEISQVDGDVLLYGHRPGKKESFTVFSKKDDASGDNAMSAIFNTIKNPEVFYICSTEPYNWIPTATVSSNDWKISNCLWGDENEIGGVLNNGFMDPEPWDGKKTIYDPSPAGWRVAPADVWTDIANANIESWINIPIANIYRSNSWSGGAPWGHEVYFNNTDVTTFLPASGYRRYNDGALCYAGTYGYSWLSFPSGQDSKNGSGMGFGSRILGVAYEYSRAEGFSIRCVRE